MKARTAIALAALLASFSALCGSVWIDGDLAPAGTGYAALAAGAVVALTAAIARGVRGMPQDSLGFAARAAWFVALASFVSLVLAPGGAWLFVELVLLVVLLARRATERAWLGLGGSASAVLVVALAFKLWLLRQGSLQQWQVAQVDVPILSWLPFEALAPLQTIDIGRFTASELGLPPAGLHFGSSASLVVLGCTSAVAALALAAWGAREHEDDRVEALLATLPPQVARAVESVLPEGEWAAAGLHHLPERKLARRIEQLVRERARGLDRSQRLLQQPEVLRWLAPEHAEDRTT